MNLFDVQMVCDACGKKIDRLPYTEVRSHSDSAGILVRLYHNDCYTGKVTLEDGK